MKIYEVTGKIRENPTPPNMQPGKVVKQSGNELTVATQAQGQPTGTELTVDLSKNPQAIQKDPQGNITIDPNAKPEPSGGMQLQPGQQINVASAPGGMLPNKTVSGQPQQVQQDQAAAEEMESDLEQEMSAMQDNYVPTGYNDKYREKAMMRKAMQSITADDQFVSESNDIVALAKRISNVPIKSSGKQKQDIINLKKLAGL